MLFASLTLLAILIPSIQAALPTLNLTFSPDAKYYEMGHTVDVFCDFNTPNDKGDQPQLWHVDFKTGKHTPVSRSLVNRPPEDAPETFKNNVNKRVQYLRKNYLRIENLQLEDSAYYKCNCPDCEETLPTKENKLQVMKLAEPVWHVEPAWPLQEKAKVTIRCTADDFYPFVDYKIIHGHREIHKDGKHIHIPTGDAYPQRFSWEGVVEPAFDWHNTTLTCTVREGAHERHAQKVLEVLFTPRFRECAQTQHVDSFKDKASITCSYAGNPAPQLVWYRQLDNTPISTDASYNVTVEPANHGQYKSILTFDRAKLVAAPLATSTKSPNAPADATTRSPIKGDNYYQQLLNSGFVAKLILSNEEKDSRKITIVGDASQARTKALGDASIQNLSTSSLLFSSLILLYLMRFY